jgi:bifunctional pyridoxal-dependent enzyme with beta-cystathionase and maltose regulon repressor activities
MGFVHINPDCPRPLLKAASARIKRALTSQ